MALNEKISSAEFERQKGFMDKIKDINEEFYNKKGRRKTMFIQTFGCQMNAHDSEKLYGMLEEMGYEPADEEKDADFVIYNTCCVRENAENRVYGISQASEKEKSLYENCALRLYDAAGDRITDYKGKVQAR